MTAHRQLMVRERVEDLGSPGGLPNGLHSCWDEPNAQPSPTVLGRDAWIRRGASGPVREIGDLGMAGLHIRAAPARLLARGRRVIQPDGSSTPLEGNPGGLLCSTFSGSSGRVDYRRRLEMNTQDSD